MKGNVGFTLVVLALAVFWVLVVWLFYESDKREKATKCEL